MGKTYIDDNNNLNTNYNGVVGNVEPDGTVRSGSRIVGHVSGNGLFTDEWGRKEWIEQDNNTSSGGGGGLAELAAMLFIYLFFGIFILIFNLIKKFFFAMKNAYIYSSTGLYPTPKNNKLPYSGFSTFSATFGFLGLVIPIAGFIGIFFGFKAFNEIKQKPYVVQGKTRALLGIIAGIFSIPYNLIVLMSIISNIMK